jgi:hypothetical protein
MGEAATGTTRIEPSASTNHSSRWEGPRAKRSRIAAGITVWPREVIVLLTSGRVNYSASYLVIQRRGWPPMADGLRPRIRLEF